jgi:urea transport system substrate-binding protein
VITPLLSASVSSPVQGRIVLDTSVLKQLRHDRQLSQEELANECSAHRVRVSISSIKRAETGNPVLFRIARELARFYDVPVERLVGRRTSIEHANASPTMRVRDVKPLIGRRDALQQFDAVLHSNVLGGKGFVLSLRGPPGIGKSRLVAEYARLAAKENLTCVVERVPDQLGYAWHKPLGGILRALLRLPPGLDESMQCETIDAYARVSDLSDEEHSHILDFLGLPLPDRLKVSLDALNFGARRAGATRLFVRLLAAFGQPLFVAVEDIQWAETNLLLTIKYLAANIVGLPVLLVLTTREHNAAVEDVWRSGMLNTPHIVLDLPPLTVPEAQALSHHFDHLAADFRSVSVRVSGGNPLFLEQLLLNYPAVHKDSPQSLRDHLLQRLNVLAAHDRQAIDAASAIGDVFDLDIVRHVIGNAHYECHELVRNHLITTPTHGHFEFCHSLIRQSIYEALDAEDMRRLHSRIAAWHHLRDPVMHAHHLDRANALCASRAYLHAAETRYEQRNYVDALTLVDKALSLDNPESDRYELARLKGLLLKLLNLPEKSILYFLETAELAHDDGQRCQAWCELTESYLIINRRTEAEKAVQQAEHYAALQGISHERRARISTLRRSLAGDDGAASQGDPEHFLQLANTASVNLDLSNILGDLSPRFAEQEACHTALPRHPSRVVKVGVLHSQTGILRELEAGVLQSTLLAFREINETGGILGCRIEPVVADGQSSETVFGEQAARLVSDPDIFTLFGCSTSSSRCRVKPLIEAHEHLLFYPFQYEGIESSQHIAYVGAAPSQQALPAVDWLFGNRCQRFALVGSDYVYPLVTNELIKERINALGGETTSEHYVPFGSRDFSTVIVELERHAADAVILTIVGQDSNYAFLKQIACLKPVPTLLSLVLSENDLAAIPPRYTEGIYTVFSYFQNLDHPLNQEFVRQHKQRFGDNSRISGYMESAYVGVYLWAKAVKKADCFKRGAVKAALKGISHFGPGGMAYVDELNNHVWRHVRIAQVGLDGEYNVIWNSNRPLKPEPYPPAKTPAQWHAFLHRLRTRWHGNWELQTAVIATPEQRL